MKISEIKNKNPPTDNQIFNMNNSNDKVSKHTSQKDKLWAHLNRKLTNDKASKLTSPRHELRTFPMRNFYMMLEGHQITSETNIIVHHPSKYCF